MRGRAVAVGVALLLAAGGCGARPAEPARPSVSRSDVHHTPATVPTKTPTQPSRPPVPLRFSVLGDVGSTTAAGKVLAGIAARRDDFTLVVGDLSYGAGGAEPDWCDFVTRALGAKHPVELVSGNHEDHGPNGDIGAFERCLPNRLPGLVGQYGREWYVDVPAGHPLVRVVMISPALDFGAGTWSYAQGTAHYAWTREAVRSARADGVPWVVVGMHKPCLSVGVYACDPGADLMNLLVQEKVDLVVTGHEHMYERTKRLALGPGCPSIVPGRYDAGCVVPSGGTTVVTVGTGGHSLRDLNRNDPEAPYFAAVSAADTNAAFGSLDVTVGPGSLTARFVPAPGSSFADSVRLTR